MGECRIRGSRELALAILHQIEADKAYTNLGLDQALRRNPLGDSDRALVTEMVYGTVKHQLTLDFVIEQLSGRPLGQLSSWVLVALRLGLYQILFLDRIPDHAAVGETVEAVKRKVNRGAVGFVNAVLRRATRGVELNFGDPQKDPAGFLSRKYSHPVWLVQSWLGQLGFAETEALLIANNQSPSIHLRVNTLKTTRQNVLDQLKNDGLTAQPSALLAEAVRLDRMIPEKTKVLRDGLAVVQDEGAMLISRVVNPEPGDRVWDVCSAPGGKTTHMAQLMHDRGRIDATDIHQHRVDMVRRLADRLGITVITAINQDAREFAVQGQSNYDRVLVDAPCSGTGVLRRKVDARWQKSPEQVEELSALQQELLAVAASAVKPGGVLVYSTCSLERAEDEDVAARFLASHVDFAPLPLRDTALPSDLFAADDHQIKLFPHRHGTDGFFAAAFRRRT